MYCENGLPSAGLSLVKWHSIAMMVGLMLYGANKIRCPNCNGLLPGNIFVAALAVSKMCGDNINCVAVWFVKPKFVVRNVWKIRVSTSL